MDDIKSSILFLKVIVDYLDRNEAHQDLYDMVDELITPLETNINLP